MQSFDDLFEEVAQEKAEQPELSPFDMDEYKARKQQERIRFYESKVKEMDADRRKKGENKARKQVEK